MLSGPFIVGGFAMLFGSLRTGFRGVLSLKKVKLSDIYVGNS